MLLRVRPEQFDMVLPPYLRFLADIHINNYILPSRHGGGSEKMDLASDPMDLVPGSIEIIDPTQSLCR